MAVTHEYGDICLLKTFLDSSFNSLNDRIIIEGYNLLRTDHFNDNKRGAV